MTKVIIEFPNQKSAKEFVSWMDNQGEQDYWVSMDASDLPKLSFSYDYTQSEGHFTIKAFKR